IELQKSKISIIQKTIADQEVKVPDLYISNSIPINPNSLMLIVYNSVPYSQPLKLKQKFSWLVLLPGALHKKMNTLKAFVELN
ncbi:30896_t:CDS:2, partial [Gigaspora margarita]